MDIKIENFRSIQNESVHLAPITLLYGPNGAGKSSLIYALLTLKNILLSPNRQPSELFNFQAINLGGYDAVVFDHQPRNKILLRFSVQNGPFIFSYEVQFGKSDALFRLEIQDEQDTFVRLEIPAAFPYSLTDSASAKMLYKGNEFTVSWNGIAAQAQPVESSPETHTQATELTSLIYSSFESLRSAGFVPLQRGFFKFQYGAVSVSPAIITEDEVATLLANERYLTARVSYYLEKIVGRDFRVHTAPGTALFSLNATDKTTGIASELVNDGFGINQLIFFLARALHHDTELIYIEEPEVHLHPSALRKLAAAVVDITRQEHKRFLISTHSEAFLLAFLSQVANKDVTPSELACYLVQKDGKVTHFERQQVNEDGQVEGGLSSFMEGELEDIMAFFGQSG